MTPTLRLTSIQLRISNLKRSLEFYAQRLGFVVLDQATGYATLAAETEGPGLLTLTESASEPTTARDAAGLFHAALLFPRRRALGAWLQLAASRQVGFDGLSDHGVSEAIYLSDPDGNGLEFYADRPHEAWPRAQGGIAMTTQPLDWRDLVAEVPPATATPLAGASWGHLHLRVTDLERSEAFYVSHLGMAVTQRTFPGARFLAADGYHHHVAINTWGQPRRPYQPEALGLVEAVFARSGTPQLGLVNDPDGIPLRLIAG